MKSIILLLILSLLWGSSFLWTKELLHVFEPSTIVFFRSLFGFLALLPFLLFKKNTIQPKKDFLLVITLALGAAIPWNIMAFSLQGLDTGISGILNATTPLFALLFSIVILKEKPIWNQLVSLFIGFLAVTILMFFSGQAPGTQFSILHGLFMLIVTMSYALNSIWVKKYYMNISALQLGFWTLFISATFNGIISLITEPQAISHLLKMDIFLSLLVLGCLSSGLGYVIFYSIVSAGGPILALMVTFIVPFITVALGTIFLKEPLHLGIAIGLPLMLISLFVMNINVWKRKRRAEQQG